MADQFDVKKDRFNSVTFNVSDQKFENDDEFIQNLEAAISEWRSTKIRGVWIKITNEYATLVPRSIQLKFEFHHAQPGYVMMSKWLPTEEPNNLPEYANQYIAAISEWRSTKIRGVWIKITNEYATLVPRLIQLKFEFHHAQPGYVMMSKWLPTEEPNNLPEYANQYIGVGGFVVNSKQQVLTIQERFQTRPHWKLPGGHADKGEDLGETAKREVFEETGIECEFESVLMFRHQHNYRYGCSDIYFVCVMRPVSEEIKPCQHEIGKCRWMDLDEYINHEEMSVGNRHIAQCYKDSLSHRGLALIPSLVQSFNGKHYNHLYSVQYKENLLQKIDK